MSVITMPDGLVFASFDVGQETYEAIESSDVTGASRTRIFGPPRWKLSMRALDGMTDTQARLWKAMMLQLRGSVNHLAAWDITRPVPRGTMRGTVTLSAAAAAGATSISVSGATANGTLETGDWLQLGSGIGSHLCAAIGPIALNASGAGTVTFEPPLRAPLTSGTTVTWNKALGHFKRSPGAGLQWQAVAGLDDGTSGFAADFLEQWT